VPKKKRTNQFGIPDYNHVRQRQIYKRWLNHSNNDWYRSAGETKTHYWIGPKTLCDRWLTGWRWEVIWRKKTDKKCESCLQKRRLLSLSFGLVK
jgi:hypothetical protein